MVTILAALALAAVTALVQERVQIAKVRVSAQQFAVHLRSARFAAVSQRSPTDVIIATDPQNTYSFTDVRGKTHTILLPQGVRITSSSSPIRFLANGTVSGGASTVLEAELSGNKLERWEINTEPLGVPRLSHARVDEI